MLNLVTLRQREIYTKLQQGALMMHVLLAGLGLVLGLVEFQEFDISIHCMIVIMICKRVKIS